MRAVFITTFDNPYDPADEFESWYKFDLAHGYETSGLLARFTATGDESTEVSDDEDLELAIDAIIELNGSGFYKKLVKDI